MKSLSVLLVAVMVFNVARAEDEKGKWIPISDGVIAKLTEEKVKIGWPGATGGITVDPVSVRSLGSHSRLHPCRQRSSLTSRYRRPLKSIVRIVVDLRLSDLCRE